MQHVKLITLTILIVFFVWAAFYFFIDNKGADRQKIAFMEMLQTLSPSKSKVEACVSNNKNLNDCSKLKGFLMKNTAERDILYFVSGESDIYGIDFQNTLVLNLKYDKSLFEWKCFGWPENVLVAECSLIKKD